MPNSPYLDKSVQWRIKTGQIDFAEPGYRGTVQAILSSGLATEVVGLIAAGKEADVYLARYNGAPLAIKAYRLYRTSHRGGRAIKVDEMGWLAAKEFEMLARAWKGGARVPTPGRRVENLLAMRYLGDDDGPAPRLKDVRVERPQAFLDEILCGIEKFAEAGLVHGDLSPYNVLVYRGDPWFIDLVDCLRVDRLGASPWRRLQQASEFLRRGLNAFEVYFRNDHIALDAEAFTKRILARLDRRGVLTQLS